ncbi:hypothetical protein C8R44DRAFT_751366 [Mycena epipterygia]|nr:hypothetical protein C8R44DRAFT_751366 [Mycena epipterygia]
MSNWDHVLAFLLWIYSLALRWLTTSTFLVIYGLVLIYLLLVVQGLANAQENSQKCRKRTLVPYYDKNGQLQGWVREEREMKKSNDSLDGFPDHHFRCHFTHQQVEDTSRLAFYWISDRLPGKRGSLDATTPEKGKLSHFKCAGIIQCKAAVCSVQIAPGTNVTRQIEALWSSSDGNCNHHTAPNISAVQYIGVTGGGSGALNETCLSEPLVDKPKGSQRRCTAVKTEDAAVIERDAVVIWEGTAIQ